MPTLPLITELSDLEAFKQCLIKNPGYFIIKLGAEWCGPCKKVEQLVNSCMEQAPENVQCAIIDVDEAFELFGFLRTKKMVNGIPAILAYKQGNLNYVPDDAVLGADPNQIAMLFARCYKDAASLQ